MMMQRIIAVLFALAVLVERSVRAPKPACWFLIHLLRPVEPIIRDFVIWTGWKAGGVAFFLPDPPSRHDESRIIALYLADCFRAFAEALQTLPRQLYERWRACEALQLALRQLAFRLGRGQPCAACTFDQPLPVIIDTS